MPKLKIRGGDLDLVEYEFSPFTPGEKINALGIGGRTLAPPGGGMATDGEISKTLQKRIRLMTSSS